MKTLDTRELHAAFPASCEEPAREQEPVAVGHDQPVARIPRVPEKRQAAPLAEHRSHMKMLPVPVETLIREERNRR